MARDIIFSVICPAFNAEKYLEESIQSVINQSYKHWELIIVDDGSTDNTSEVANRYTHLENIHYFRQDNGKQGKARNYGITKAKGQWIAFLDADDVWFDSKLEKQSEHINLYNAQLYCTGAYMCDEELRVIEHKAPWKGLIDGKKYLLPNLLQGINPIIFSSVVINRKTLSAMGGFSEQINLAEDYEFFLRFCNTDHVLYFSSDIMVKYRIHGSQTSHHPIRAFELCINAFKAAKINSISSMDKNRLINIRVGKYMLNNIDYLTRTEINRLIRLYPLGLINVIRKNIIYILSFNKIILKKMAYRCSFILY